MAVIRGKTHWRTAEILLCGGRPVAICRNLGEVELDRAHRTGTIAIVLVTALKAVLFGGVFHGWLFALYTGGIPTFLFGGVMVLISALYLSVGFHPLVFGEYVTGSVKVYPVTAGEAELLKVFLKRRTEHENLEASAD